jgi:hypothetical protein
MAAHDSWRCASTHSLGANREQLMDSVERLQLTRLTIDVDGSVVRTAVKVR